MFLQGSYFILNSHRQCMRVQCLHILANTLLSDFSILAIFVGVKWQVIMVLIYSSLRTDAEKAMAPHSSTLAWKLPWMEEPGGLQSMGSRRVGHDFTFTFTFHFHALEKEMATHSSTLAWRIPGTGEPDGLLSMGLYRVGHD